jgi:hypothetical protein
MIQHGNCIPESYLRRLYGKDHWLFQPVPKVPEAVERFLEDL